jgi:hypothetical protein
MSKVYRITPLEKKSIYYGAEMYRNNPDGTISWFNVEDHYRWGQGFIEEDMAVNLPRADEDTAYCDPNAGWGAELEDGVAQVFEFSDDLTDEEKIEVEEAFRDGGLGWLLDGDHDWEIEDDYIVVLGPFKVDLCESNGTVIEENVKLRTLESLINPSTSFPTN